MMKKNDEFYIGYSKDVGPETKKSVRRFVTGGILVVVLAAFLFAFYQRPAVNSSFDLGNPTKVVGIYHQSPYPMLRVPLAGDETEEILLLGFGKSGANPYLEKVGREEGSLAGRQLTIEGELIYYNGKTLLQIADMKNVSVQGKGKIDTPIASGEMQVEGEVVDPKCYFGVMKPGLGKIHRSCAALCISGGIPPVLVSKDANGDEIYYLLTDLKGNPVHKDILPYIGQPSRFEGEVSVLGEWNLLKMDVDQIATLDKKSSIYEYEKDSTAVVRTY